MIARTYILLIGGAMSKKEKVAEQFKFPFFLLFKKKNVSKVQYSLWLFSSWRPLKIFFVCSFYYVNWDDPIYDQFEDFEDQVQFYPPHPPFFRVILYQHDHYICPWSWTRRSSPHQQFQTKEPREQSDSTMRWKLMNNLMHKIIFSFQFITLPLRCPVGRQHNHPTVLKWKISPPSMGWMQIV